MEKHNYVPIQLVAEAMREVGPLTTIRKIDDLMQLIKNGFPELGYLPMHLGNPSSRTPKELIMYEKMALDLGVTSFYAPSYGFNDLNVVCADFVHKFVGTKSSSILQTLGGAHASWESMAALQRLSGSSKNAMIIFTPAFPVHMLQAKTLGIRTIPFEFPDFRGDKLEAALEEILKKENCGVHAILYSNPRNPTWFCLTPEELETIANLAEKYGVVVMEDLAYFCMDFREKLGILGAQYQPSVSNYTDNYLLFFSGSKIFSYPGGRFGFIVMGDQLAKKKIGSNTLYREIALCDTAVTVSSAPSASQKAMLYYLGDINSGKIDFIQPLKEEYESKAKAIRELFEKHGFPVLYDDDCGRPLANGFYFTSFHPHLSGNQVAEKFPPFGMSVTPVEMCWGKRQGFRVCTASIKLEQLSILDERLGSFVCDYPTN